MGNSPKKYRGRRLDANEWVYGYLAVAFTASTGYSEKGPSIQGYADDDTPYHEEVHPDTVGQFTGRKEKNDVDVYEADRIWIQKYGNGTVFWHELHCVFYVRMDKKHMGGDLLLLPEDSRRMKVIGTIYDKEKL